MKTLIVYFEMEGNENGRRKTICIGCRSDIVAQA